MSAIAVAVIAGGLIGNAMQSNATKKAADTAAEAQQSSANLAVNEQRRQFDNITQLLEPYVASGNASLGRQFSMLGLMGDDAQKESIAGIENSALFKDIAKQGENAILQNASATGGLRGGNTEAALAQFRPNLLNSMIQQQYTNLGGLTSLGQNSAAITGNAGMQSANSIADLYGQMGAAQAGAALARGKADAQFYGQMGSSLGMLASGGGGTTVVNNTAPASSGGGGGGGGGGLLGGLTSAIGGLFSDRRLKENVILVGKDEATGLNIYEFNYIGSDQRYCGVMADEVEQLIPEAVTNTEDGYKHVDYHKLGIEMFAVGGEE